MIIKMLINQKTKILSYFLRKYNFLKSKCIIVNGYIINYLKLLKIKNNSNLKYSFLLTFILDGLNINIPDNASHHVNYCFNIFILSLICLLNFINVIGYLLSIYVINKYDVETKFPKFKKVILYYENSSLFFVFLEGLICVLFLLCIIIFSLIEVGIPIINNK